MRHPYAGVWHHRARALAWRAPARDDGSGIPGLLEWRDPAVEEDAGAHGWGQCPICLTDFISGMPVPAAQGHQPAADCPRPPGSFAAPCPHVLCYECDTGQGAHAVPRCPLCRADRV